MSAPRAGVIFAFIFGLIPVVLGIIALVTNRWLKAEVSLPATLGSGTVVKHYSVLRKNGAIIPEDSLFKVVQGILVAGVAAIFVGIVASMIIQLSLKNRASRFIVSILISSGAILLIIGLLLFAKIVFETAAKVIPPDSTTKISLGYSLILMVICSILGFLTSSIFTFLSGFNGSAQKTGPVAKREFPSITEF